MKLQMFKFATLLALFMGCFSCTEKEDWPQDEFQPVNPGGKSSYFAIDNNIISFAVPYLVHTRVAEYPLQPNYGSPEGFSPHFWTISLTFAKGIDVTKLPPIITLAPGAIITEIYTGDPPRFPKQVYYTDIANVGVLDFSKQVDLVVIAPDGSTVNYKFLATAIGDDLPCGNCPP